RSQALSLSFTTKSASLGAGSGASADLQIGTGANSLTLSQAQIVLAEIELSPGGSCSTTDEADDCDALETAPALVDLPVDGTPKVALDGVVPPGTYSALQAQLDAVTPDEDEPGGTRLLHAHPNLPGLSGQARRSCTDAHSPHNHATLTYG